MPLITVSATEALERLDAFSAIVDARSESEYALDRLPGAVNWPTLNDAERTSVGTEYKQDSPFSARKRGAVLAARNIAAHIERHALELPRDWSPLVYCWRGGQRSGSLGLVAAFEQVDAKADLAEYQAERIASLAAAPAVDERRPVARQFEHVTLDMRCDVARDQRGAALPRGERRHLLVLGADRNALGVVQRRPVDCPREVVERELAFGACVDDGAEGIEALQRLGRGNGDQRHRSPDSLRR